MNAHLLRPLCCALLAALAGTAHVQAAAPTEPDKTIVAQAEAPAGGWLSAFAGLGRWLTGLPQPAAQPVPAGVPPALALAPPAAAPAPSNYEPLPVVMGEPALPLQGPMTPQTKAWGSGFNYQGLQLKLQVLSRDGRKLLVHPASHPLKVGERFRILVTPTFNGTLSIDHVAGQGWQAQRGARVFPSTGSTVALVAGEPHAVPGGDTWFQLGPKDSTRFVLNVRQGSGENLSNQPAYRQDGATASNYLQLVPPGKLAAFEQLFSVAR